MISAVSMAYSTGSSALGREPTTAALRGRIERGLALRWNSVRVDTIASAHWKIAESGFRISWLVMSIKFSCWRFSSTASCLRCDWRPSTHFWWLISVSAPVMYWFSPIVCVRGFTHQFINFRADISRKVGFT
jgi:hypothetical protein